MIRTPRSFSTVALVTAALLAFGVAPASAADDPVYVAISEYASLETAAAGPVGAPCPPMQYLRLDADIVEPAADLELRCSLTIDLNGHALTLQSIAINSTMELVVEDTTPEADGTLTVDASDEAGIPAILISNASFTLTGGIVTAHGGRFAAGIGGTGGYTDDDNPANDVPESADGGTLTVHGGALDAVGGQAAPGLGAVDLWSGATSDILIDGGEVRTTGGGGGPGITGGVTVDGGLLETSGSTSAGEGIKGSLHLLSGAVTAFGTGGAVGITGAVSVDGGELHVTAPGGDSSGITGTTTITGGDVTITAGDAGIRADLTISNANLTVTGGSHAAGIGGGGAFVGPETSGRTVVIGDGAVVTATGGATAIGAGAHGDDFGSLTVSGLLRLPTSGLHILNSAVGDEVTVLPGGRIEGTSADPTSGGALTGGGSIDNGGSITLAETLVEVEVLDHNYLVTFDAQQGEPTPDAVRVFAATFDDGARVVPDLPSRFSLVATEWNFAVDGTGAAFTDATSIDGDVTVYASWVDDASVKPGTWEDLETALDGCSGAVEVQLADDIPADTTASIGDRLAVDCDLTLDVAGHRLALDGIDVAPGVDLTLEDSVGGGLVELHATANGDPGIRVADASLTVLALELDVQGGALAAGIGGGSGENGGDVVIGDGSEVSATGGASAIGAGSGGTIFGSLVVEELLSLPSGQLLLLDGAGPEVTVTSTGRIEGAALDITAGAEFVGAGQVQNDGAITLATAHLTGGVVEILGNNFLVSFDPSYAATTVDDVQVFAPTFDAGARDLPSLPEYAGLPADSWQLVGVDFDADTTLTGDATLVAHWSDLTFVTVTDASDLTTALDACTGAVVLELTGDLPVDTSAALNTRLEPDCDVVIHLNGHRLALETITLDAGRSLAIDDTVGGGELVADASAHNFNDGLRISHATLRVLGGTVTAISGLDGVGVGSGHGNGGTIEIAAGAELIAIGDYSALGAGIGRDEFGTVTVDGTLRLPSGSVIMPAGTGSAITVGSTGRIVGTVSDETDGAQFSGSGNIVNFGVVTLASALFTGVTVSEHAYTVAFDAQGGTPASTDVVVFATTFDEGLRSIPAAPTRSGYSFDGWTIDAAGAGAEFTAATALAGDRTVYAQWTADPTPTPTPTSGPAPSPAPGPGSGAGSSPGSSDTDDSSQPEPTATPTPTATPSPTEEPTAAEGPDGAGAPASGESGWDAWWILAGFGVLLIVVVTGVVIFVRRG